MQFKKHIVVLPQQTHGGIQYQESRREGRTASAILDFSVNCNPYGPPPGLKKNILKALISRYPDPDSTELKQALARKHGLRKDNIFVGSGSTEIIRMIPVAFFSPGDKAIIPSPTYSEYEISCRIMGLKIVIACATKNTKYYWDIEVLIKTIKRVNPAVIFLCNPNNPTGQYLTRAEVAAILTASVKTMVILDEAYIAFTDDTWSSLELLHYENLMIVRSMTKDYALAGLRLGYAIASPQIISILYKVRAPWNVSVIAQAAGMYAIQHDPYLDQCKVKIEQAKEFLMQNLTNMGFQVIPSRSNFFLVKVGNAGKFKTALLNKDILVRDCTSFGLPDYIRVSPLSLSACKKFISAVKETGTS